MSRSLLLLAVVGVGLMVGPVDRRELLAQPERPEFRLGVDLVSLSVTVTDASRRYVADLDRNDFVIVENGVPQNLTFFARTGVPLALALLIDSSASMEQSMVTAQEAAIGFARQLGPADMATVVDFDSRVQIAQGFTSDIVALENAIRGTSAGGSTVLYNALYIALKELAKLIPQDDPGAPRRRAIVVLSDGADTVQPRQFRRSPRSGIALRHCYLHNRSWCPRTDGASERRRRTIRPQTPGAANGRPGLLSVTEQRPGRCVR